MMQNDKRAIPMYSKSNKFIICLKKLYRERKIPDAPHLNFVYKESTDRIVSKPKQADMLDKRYKLTNVIEKAFKSQFEILNGVVTKTSAGVSYQPSEVNDVTAIYNFQIKDYAGKTIKFVIKVNVKQIYSTGCTQNWIKNWWSHHSTDFIQSSSVSRVYGELADLFLTAKDSILRSMNDLVTINIVQSVKLEKKNGNKTKVC